MESLDLGETKLPFVITMVSLIVPSCWTVARYCPLINMTATVIILYEFPAKCALDYTMHISIKYRAQSQRQLDVSVKCQIGRWHSFFKKRGHNNNTGGVVPQRTRNKTNAIIRRQFNGFKTRLTYRQHGTPCSASASNDSSLNIRRRPLTQTISFPEMTVTGCM